MPQLGHAHPSTPKLCHSNSAQSACLRRGSWVAHFRNGLNLSNSDRFGTISRLHLALGAKTPWYKTWLTLGKTQVTGNPLDFHIGHTLLLIALGDSSGKYEGLREGKLCYALCCAVFVELQFANRLIPVLADAFTVVGGPPLMESLEVAATELTGNTYTTQKGILKLFHMRTSMLVWLRGELIQGGVLEKRADRFLGVRHRTRYPLHVEAEVERALREELVAYADTVTPEAPPSRLDGLLSLLRFFKLLDNTLGPELAMSSTVQKRADIVPLGALAQTWGPYI